MRDEMLCHVVKNAGKEYCIRHEYRAIKKPSHSITKKIKDPKKVKLNLMAILSIG